MKEELRTQIRMPLELGTWLKEIAIKNSRSMNGQMVALMKERMESMRKMEKIPSGSIQNEVQ